MKPLHIETPLFESRPLSILAGRSVWLKLDALQPPGSFKIRGIGFACQEYVRRGASRLISSSGGNAGIAVAYAGRHLSVPVLIVVPETTSDRAKALIRQEGAEVLVHGDSWQEANELATSTVDESDVLVHPFDDPLVWQGHSTLIDEVARSGVKPGALVVSVGGGGLLCGLVEGMSGPPGRAARHHQPRHHAGSEEDLRTGVRVHPGSSASKHRRVGSGRRVGVSAVSRRPPAGRRAGLRRIASRRV